MAVWAFSGILFLVFPGVSVLIGLPAVLGLLPALTAGQWHPLTAALVGANLVGLLAAPGYFVAAFNAPRLPTLERGGRIWIGASLLGALAATLVAVPATIFLYWPFAVFPAGTLVLCLALLVRCRRAWSPRDD